LLTFLTLADISSNCFVFQLPAAKLLEIWDFMGALCEHRLGDAFCIHWQQYR